MQTLGNGRTGTSRDKYGISLAVQSDMTSEKPVEVDQDRSRTFLGSAYSFQA